MSSRNVDEQVILEGAQGLDLGIDSEALDRRNRRRQLDRSAAAAGCCATLADNTP